jgi:hypothetical protein
VIAERTLTDEAIRRILRTTAEDLEARNRGKRIEQWKPPSTRRLR